jgi:hypothetical protein
MIAYSSYVSQKAKLSIMTNTTPFSQYYVVI